MSPEPFIEIAIGDKYIFRLWRSETDKDGEPVYALRLTAEEAKFHQGMLDDCFPREPRKM